MSKNIITIALLWLFNLVGCELFTEDSHPVFLKHAKRFSIEQKSGLTYITIPKAYFGSKQTYKYCLVPKVKKSFDAKKGYQIIRTPVDSVVALSTTMLPFIEKLGVLDKLVAVDREKYINTKSVIKKIKQKKVVEVGSSHNLNIELIYDLKPDLVLTFATGSKFDTHHKLKTASIDYMMTCSYLESSLLGRTEWIKFFGLLFGVEKKAAKIFDEIEIKYQTLKQLAQKEKKRPSVFCNVPFRGIWYLPGGESWMANTLADAKANYLWSNSQSFAALRLNFEIVIEKAINADFWLCSSTTKWKTIGDVEKTDNRFKFFDAYKKGKVFVNDKMVNKLGGNAIFELGMISPELILQDLIKIFHPHLLTEQPFTFYNQLSKS